MRVPLKTPILGLTSSLGILMVGCGPKADFGGPAEARRAEDADGIVDPSAGTVTETETGTATATDTGTDANPGGPPDGGPYASLTWYWECDAEPGTAPNPTSDRDAVVKGVGPHEFEPSALQGTPITLAGKMCAPAARPRDIVFVVDVSGSMEADHNDPRVGDTCGRLQAIEGVISTLNAGVARLGIVTFSGETQYHSLALAADQAALFAPLGGTPADVVCASDGDTNYEAALVSARELLGTGRAGASKEIYFISDGAPTGGDHGKDVASQLRTVGVNIGTDFVPVTIATVMLRGNDQVMEKYIASKRPDGLPLHAKVEATGQLAEILKSLSANEVVGAELKWRPVGEEDWTVSNVLHYAAGLDFSLPSITIDTGSAPQGVEVAFEYWDRHGNRYKTGGHLKWALTATTDEGP